MTMDIGSKSISNVHERFTIKWSLILYFLRRSRGNSWPLFVKRNIIALISRIFVSDLNSDIKLFVFIEEFASVKNRL
jgi:hypothetical protein